MHLQQKSQSSEIPAAIRAAFPELQPPPVFTVKQFSARNPAFPQAALRNLIFKAEPRYSTKGEIPGNGLIECGAIIRLGRKVIIHEARFFEWIETQQKRRRP